MSETQRTPLPRTGRPRFDETAARHARKRAETRRAQGVALGQAWAEHKATQLRGSIAPDEWPDFWNDADNGPLPLRLAEDERRELARTAARAAHEHWVELVADERSSGAADESDGDSEARAAELEAELWGTLPRGVSVGRDATRVFLLLGETGTEKTVGSLAEASRCIDDWSSQRRFDEEATSL